jgi:hypothetical protein
MGIEYIAPDPPTLPLTSAVPDAILLHAMHFGFGLSGGQPSR